MTRARVLLVEDDPDQREALEACVRSPEVDDLSVVTNVYKRGLKAILIDKLCIILAVDLYKVPRPNAFLVGQ